MAIVKLLRQSCKVCNEKADFELTSDYGALVGYYCVRHINVAKFAQEEEEKIDTCVYVRPRTT